MESPEEQPAKDSGPQAHPRWSLWQAGPMCTTLLEVHRVMEDMWTGPEFQKAPSPHSQEQLWEAGEWPDPMGWPDPIGHPKVAASGTQERGGWFIPNMIAQICGSSDLL